jgi:hypothetical protein
MTTFARKLAAGALVATLWLTFAACGDDDDTSTDETTTEAPAETTTTTGAETTTTAPEGLEQPALWPAADVTFDDPVAAAQDFLDQVVGNGQAGEFRQGDARSGEVDALFVPEPGADATVRSILLVRQLGPDSGWFVIAAISEAQTITVPEALAEVTAGPLAVEGAGRGFEAQLHLSAFVAGQAGEPLDEQFPLGGAMETPEPFTATLDLTGAEPGDTVTLLLQGGVGHELDPGEFTAFPIVIAS